MHLDRLGWLAALLLALFAVMQTARLARARGAAARRLARIRERGRRGERLASAVIERAGYRIDAVQPELDWTIYCDGQAHPVLLRADLLVSRAGRRFIAEIKTGSASQLATPSTRRQLLEYSVAYAVDGVLLVDMERQRVHEVSFEPAPEAGGGRRAFWLVVLVVAVACAVLRSR